MVKGRVERAPVETPVKDSPTWGVAWQFDIESEHNGRKETRVYVGPWFPSQIVTGDEYRIEGYPGSGGRLDAERVEDLRPQATYMAGPRFRRPKGKKVIIDGGSIIATHPFDFAGEGQGGVRECGWHFELEFPGQEHTRAVRLLQGEEFGSAIHNGMNVTVEGIEESSGLIHATLVTDVDSGLQIPGLARPSRWWMRGWRGALLALGVLALVGLLFFIIVTLMDANFG